LCCHRCSVSNTPVAAGGTGAAVRLSGSAALLRLHPSPVETSGARNCFASPTPYPLGCIAFTPVSGCGCRCCCAKSSLPALPLLCCAS
jgi:hypothetical protein